MAETYEHFDPDFRYINKRFYAVLLNDVILETSNETIDKLYKRGIYTFRTRDERNTFTKLCNDGKTNVVALRYTMKPNERNKK